MVTTYFYSMPMTWSLLSSVNKNNQDKSSNRGCHYTFEAASIILTIMRMDKPEKDPDLTEYYTKNVLKLVNVNQPGTQRNHSRLCSVGHI